MKSDSPQLCQLQLKIQSNRNFPPTPHLVFFSWNFISYHFYKLGYIILYNWKGKKCLRYPSKSRLSIIMLYRSQTNAEPIYCHPPARLKHYSHLLSLSSSAKCRLDLITINPFSGHFHNLILLPFFQISFPLFMNYSRQRQEYQAFPLWGLYEEILQNYSRTPRSKKFETYIAQIWNNAIQHMLPTTISRALAILYFKLGQLCPHFH